MQPDPANPKDPCEENGLRCDEVCEHNGDQKVSTRGWWGGTRWRAQCVHVLDASAPQMKSQPSPTEFRPRPALGALKS